jgi:hypothetical protein
VAATVLTEVARTSKETSAIWQSRVDTCCGKNNGGI